MRALGFALLAVGLSSCSPIEPGIDESDDPKDDIVEDDDVVPIADGGRRDAGKDAGRDAGRIDSGFPRVPFFDGGLFPFQDAGTAPVPPRLSLLMKSERPLPPLSGGTLAVRGAGDIAVAADPDRDRIYVVTLDASKRPLTLELEPGSEPGRVVIDDRGRAHVALRGAGQVLTLGLANGQILARTPLCTLPRGLAYDAAKDALVIACAGGELLTVAAGTHQVISNVELALDLRDVVVDLDGTRIVSRYRSAELLRVSEAGQLLTVSEPAHQSQSLGNDIQFLPSGEIVDKGPIVQESSPTLAWRLVPGEDRVLMLHQQARDNEIDLQPDAGLGGSAYGGGCSTITSHALTVFGNDGATGPTIQLAPHGLVVDVARSPDGQFAAFAEPGSYLRALPTVEVVNLTSFVGGFLPGQDLSVDAGAPFSPTCVSGWPTGADYQATAVAYDDGGRLYVFSREPAGLHVYAPFDPNFGTTSPEREFVLALESVRDTGHELFHADVGAGMACAGCHGEALDDGHVWNFAGFGPRRTQTMRGGLLSTLPLHWEGDLPTFQSLVDEVMTRRMGGFAVEPKFGEALAGWLDKLPPLKLGRPEDSAVLRGKALFESAEVACASCHGGTHFTNNQSADVGTGGLFQVPTLLGIALHPPFLHDGCAKTLEERFAQDCGGGDAHGHTSHLTPAEIADLVSYLKTL